MRFKTSSRLLAVGASAAVMVLAATGVGHADPADTPLAAAERVINSSGKCLEIENSSTANGANAQQWTCVGQAGANWKFVERTPTEFWIVNAKSGKCLETENGWTHNGAPVQQWTCTPGVKHQTWTAVSPIPGGGVALLNQGTRKYLEVENSSGTNGARVQQWQAADVRGQSWSFG